MVWRIAWRRTLHGAAITVLSTAILAAALPAPKARATSNIVVAWGANFEGQLGDGARELSPGELQEASWLPVPVTGLSNVTAIAAGGEQALALLTNETVVAWGANYDGQLGNGSTVDSDVPVPVSSVTKATAISAGAFHSMACAEATHACEEKGKPMMWGANDTGQLGDKKYERSTTPVAAPVPSGEIKAIAAGGEDSVALCLHQVYAWGNDESGQVGNGNFAEEQNEPRLVHGVAGSGYLKEVKAISAGREDNLALLENGTVVAWGANAQGQLGNGTTTNSPVPVVVSGLHEVVAISAGGEHNLALLANGTVMAWGSNTSGQLGTGSPEEYIAVPTPVESLKAVKQIASGGEHSLALLTSGTVDAWGANQSGQLGNGHEEGEPVGVPEPVPGLSAIQGISAGYEFSVAFGAPPPTPTVSSVGPSLGPAGGGTAVTLTGSHLTLASEIRFGAVAVRAFAVQSDHAISAIAPPGAGTVLVTVTTPGGISASSEAAMYTYEA
jgi:alpha-tubulin suppressor-like RCC1 family protein